MFEIMSAGVYNAAHSDCRVSLSIRHLTYPPPISHTPVHTKNPRETENNMASLP
jgi:hypothetical protein